MMTENLWLVITGVTRTTQILICANTAQVYYANAYDAENTGSWETSAYIHVSVAENTTETTILFMLWIITKTVIPIQSYGMLPAEQDLNTAKHQQEGDINYGITHL